MTLNAAQFIALNIFSKSFNITSGQKFLLQWFCKKWISIIVIVRVSDCLSGGLGIFYFLVMLVILKYKQCQSYNDCDNDCRAHTISNSIEFMTVSAKLYCRDLGPEKCLIGWEARKKKKNMTTCRISWENLPFSLALSSCGANLYARTFCDYWPS